MGALDHARHLLLEVGNIGKRGVAPYHRVHEHIVRALCDEDPLSRLVLLEQAVTMADQRSLGAFASYARALRAETLVQLNDERAIPSINEALFHHARLQGSEYALDVTTLGGTILRKVGHPLAVDAVRAGVRCIEETLRTTTHVALKSSFLKTPLVGRALALAADSFVEVRSIDGRDMDTLGA